MYSLKNQGFQQETVSDPLTVINRKWSLARHNIFHILLQLPFILNFMYCYSR